MKKIKVLPNGVQLPAGYSVECDGIKGDYLINPTVLQPYRRDHLKGVIATYIGSISSDSILATITTHQSTGNAGLVHG